MIQLKFKKTRRIGENVWLHHKMTPKQKTVIYKLKQKTKANQSDFAITLQNRNKLALLYGIRGKTLIKYRKSSTHLNKNKNILLFLETRLDIILVRANFCHNISRARQFIAHNKICVNFKTINISSFHVQVGDIVSVCHAAQKLIRSGITARTQLQPQSPQSLNADEIFYVKPSHLEINYKLFTIVLVKEPCKIKFPYNIELDMI